MGRALSRSGVIAALLLLVANASAGTACSRREPPGIDSPARLALTTTAAAATVTAPLPPPDAAAPDATPASPRFVGRWVADPRGMRCGWSGCYVVARFSGTQISARIKDEGFNLFQVVVDGEVKKVLRTDNKRGEAVYLLADGLAAGEHDVSVHRRTESKVGELVFHSFEPGPGGKLLPPPPPPARRIETIGDSISNGYGNEGPKAECGYVNSQQNEYATYAAITARNLGADHTTIAWSGKSTYEMRVLFDKALPQRKDGPLWDFAQYQPDVVIVNLGTNDFANVDPGEALFVKVYEHLVHDVRAAYPNAFIVCTLGSMLTNVFPEGRNALTQARKYMKVAMAQLRESDPNVDFIEFPEQNHANGLGCGFHPSLKTHQLMAEQLTAFLKERMGW